MLILPTHTHIMPVGGSLCTALGVDRTCPCWQPLLNLLLSGQDMNVSIDRLHQAVEKTLSPDALHDHVFFTILNESTIQDIPRASHYKRVAEGCAKDPSHILTTKEDDGTPMIDADAMADKIKKAYEKYRAS